MKKKIEKPKDVGHFLVQRLSQNFDFCACPSKNVIKRDASGNKGCCYVANAFLSRLELIWPISSLEISKMSKKICFWQEAPGVNGLIKAHLKGGTYLKEGTYWKEGAKSSHYSIYFFFPQKFQFHQARGSAWKPAAKADVDSLLNIVIYIMDYDTRCYYYCGFQ